MMRSLNEVGAMVQKAAIGAGIPVGQAEDLGRVAVFLTQSGGDLACVSAALCEAECPLQVEWDARHVRIIGGTAALAAPVIRDAFTAGAGEAVLADAAHLPLVQATLAAWGYAVTADGQRLTCSKTAKPDWAKGPVEVPDADWQVWETFAARTYVPASDVSRAAGAGAGLSDND